MSELSPSSSSNPTPTQQLAGMLREKLLVAGLIAPSKAEEFERKLISGQLKQDDWKLLLEQAASSTAGGQP